MRFAADGKNFLDWADITVSVIALADRIEKHNYEPKRILAVARGGLIPAAMLAHRLGVQEVGSIQIESYKDSKRNKIRMYKQLDLDALRDVNNFQYWGAHAAYWDKVDTLVVDDLWDSGETHRWIKEMYPNVVTSTLFYKDRGDGHSHRIVSFPGSPLNKDNWVVFPWEV